MSYGVGPIFNAAGPQYEPGYPYVLYVGNFRAHKNLNRLLAAFAQVDFPELRLILSGRKTPDMVEQIQVLNLSGRVEFAGILSDEALARLYRGARCLIFPSLLEGFGLPALEAMACGTPVIVSRTTALPEVVGSAGMLIDPLDVDNIRQAIELVLGDADLRGRMRTAGILRAQNFGWDRVVATVYQVLCEAEMSAS
jgi:glycosyltransferase involved in cell wall biosynthesis